MNTVCVKPSLTMNALWFVCVAFLCVQVRGVDIDKIREFYRTNLDLKSTTALDDYAVGRKLFYHDVWRFFVIKSQINGLVQKTIADKLTSVKATHDELLNKAIEENKPESVNTCLDDTYNKIVTELTDLKTGQKNILNTFSKDYVNNSLIHRTDFNTVNEDLKNITTWFTPQLDSLTDETLLQRVFLEATTTFSTLTTYLNELNRKVQSTFAVYLQGTDSVTKIWNHHVDFHVKYGLDKLTTCYTNAKESTQ